MKKKIFTGLLIGQFLYFVYISVFYNYGMISFY